MKIFAKVFLVLLLVGILAISFFPEAGSQVDIATSLQEPGWGAWFGKDSLGRDIFARALQGAQISVLLGLGSSLAALTLGLGYGALSAMSKRWMDSVFMRLCDILMSLPSVMLMAILALLFQTLLPDENLLALFAVLTFGSWMPFARVSRNLVLKEKSQDYVDAARALGASSWRIFFRHITPNLRSSLAIYWSLQIPHALLAEGLLSFLGFGVKSPGVSWGALLQEGWKSLATYPHLLWGPALFLFLTVLSLNILLENVRRSLEPQFKLEKLP